MIVAAPWNEPHAAVVEPVDPGYAGLATRALAFAVDGAIVNGAAWFVGIVVALALSLFKIPDDVRTVFVAVGAALALLWTLAYFTFFWSTTGQTPGNRMMRIEVRAAASGDTLRARRALARVLLIPLSIILLGAGVLLILVERRRRALHDCLVGSVVTHTREPTRPQPGHHVVIAAAHQRPAT
jgi:uncharacterized RDD family membrane protein YckC